MIDKTLAILAGGKSSRMNYNNKAFLKYQEKTFIEKIIELANEYKEVIIVSNEKEIYKQFGIKVVKDIYKGHGPLGGIHAALLNSTTDKVLCVACDMPLITKELINILGMHCEEYEVLIPKVNEQLQPLCSVYSKGIISEIEQRIINNENKLQKLIVNLNYKIIESIDGKMLAQRDFYNVNTPEDYNLLEEL